MESFSPKKESIQKLKEIIKEEIKEEIKKEERINESRTNHAAPITERESKKLYNAIMGINITLSEKNLFLEQDFLLNLI